MELPVILVICSVIFSRCHGDYTCLCNYNVEIPVYSGADRSTQVLGYLYEFDCKNLLSDSNPTWSPIEFEHKMGFIENNGQVKIQTCPGDIPDEDRIKSTSVPKSTLLTTKVTTSETKTVASSFSSAKMTSPPTTSTFHQTSLLPPTITSLSPTSLPATTIPGSSISSDLTRRYNSFTTQTSNHSSTSISTDLSTHNISSTISTTTTLYTLLSMTNSSTKALAKLSTSNKSQKLSSTQSSITTISTKPKTNPLSSFSSSKLSTFTTIIPVSSIVTNALSTNLVSASTSNGTPQNPSTKNSLIQSLPTSITPHSSTYEFGSDSTPLPDFFSTLNSSSTPAPSEQSTFLSTRSKSSSSSSSTFTRKPHTFTQQLTMSPGSSNFTTTPDSSKTPSYYPSSYTVASVSTRVPPTTLSSTSDQTFIENSTHTTENVPVSDRVDLCPYRNLAMSVYNRTTFTYPLFRQYGSYCYELRLTLGNWFEAQRDCVSRGGELAVIQNEEVQERVFNLTTSLQYKTDVWIGLQDLNLEGRWEWVNGEKLAKTSFNKGILINPVLSDAQDCVLMDGKSGIWKNTACKTFLLDIQSYPWVCQYKMT
ncbi:serine-rich adhesin for platelets-like [Mercenaria mercenaria]|uniref:serine-rich adhesin for platelets-like n=1 Tax=Mercenaria mercenaria TaxID=6596 RepID=UPI00234E7CC2|nr:serine-rich adhesin for platelets-like [Mercenaria mercenaria]